MAESSSPPVEHVRAPALGAILGLVLCVIVAWGLADGRPPSATVVLYMLVGTAIVLPFVVALIQLAHNPRSVAARDTLYLASVAVLALMLIGTLLRCAATYGSFSKESDLARGGGIFFFGTLKFLASGWTLVLVAGIPVAIMLRSLMRATRAMRVSDADASDGGLRRATALTFAASVGILAMIPVWSSIGVPSWTLPDPYSREAALAQLQFAHECLHTQALASLPEQGYPAQFDSAAPCFRPLIRASNGTPRPWAATYEARGRLSDGGAAHYGLRLTAILPTSPSGESTWLDDAGQLRRSTTSTPAGDGIGDLLSDLTGCRAMTALIVALRAHRDANPSSGFPGRIAYDSTDIKAGAVDTLLPRDSLLLRGSFNYGSDDEEEVRIGYDEGVLHYVRLRDSTTGRASRFRVQWRPEVSRNGLGPYPIGETDLSQKLRAYVADQVNPIRAFSALGMVGDRLSPAPECQKGI